MNEPIRAGGAMAGPEPKTQEPVMVLFVTASAGVREVQIHAANQDQARALGLYFRLLGPIDELDEAARRSAA